MPSPALPHRLLEGSLHLRPGRLVIDLGRLRILVPQELLKQVLGHSLIGQALRHRVAKQVRVDILPDLRDRSEFLDDLLQSPLGVRTTSRRRKDESGVAIAEVDPELVGKALEDRNVPGLAAFVANPDLEFGEGNVFYAELAESADAASGFRKPSGSRGRGSHWSHRQRGGGHRAPRA